jgi:glycosyltransferase involved in cell wall biosynthesis
VPTYNRAALLPQALESILQQVEPQDEVLVVDDGSTDDTAGLMRRYAGRVRYEVLPRGGAGRARNRALAMTDRPLVAYLDSDDEWMPGKLALQRRLFEARPEVLFSFSNFACRMQDGAVDRHHLREWNVDPRGWEFILPPGRQYSTLAQLPPGIEDFKVYLGDIYLQELEGDHILTSTMMVRREAAGDALHFAEDLPVLENKECFARLAGRGPAAYLDTDTTWQNGHSGPRLTHTHKVEWSTARLAVIDRVWQRDPAFVDRYRDRLARAVRQQHLERAKLLLTLGRTREARDDLRQVPNTPVKIRLLSALPGSVLQGMLMVRNRLRAARA